MADEPTSWLAQRDDLQRTFGGLRHAGNEFEQLVNEQFDQLESLHAQLEEREREIEAARADLQRQSASLAESQQRLDEVSSAAASSVQALQGFADRFVADTGRQVQGDLEAMRQECQRLRDEFEESKTHAQSLAATLSADLALARADLATVSEDLVRQRQGLAEAETSLAEAIAARVVGKAQLLALAVAEPAREEAPDVPNTAPAASLESETTPADQPQPAPLLDTGAVAAPASVDNKDNAVDPAVADDHGQWWGVLKQLRTRRDSVPAQMARNRQAPPPDSQTDPQMAEALAAAKSGSRRAGDDPVFDSVMAQFETLRKDLVDLRPQQPVHKP